MATRTTYHSLAELGIPHGTVHGDPIFLAQDEYTRQYHAVDANTFIALCNDSWKKDEVMKYAYSGNIALIDPPTQTVAHIYDCDMTTESELRNFDACMAQEVLRLMKNNGK